MSSVLQITKANLKQRYNPANKLKPRPGLAITTAELCSMSQRLLPLLFPPRAGTSLCPVGP